MSDTWRQNAIVQAIQIIADKKIAQAGYDKTIKGVINKVLDSASGKYQVRYQDSLFEAYATSSKITYNKDQEVSVLIPGNDWDRVKTILGGVNSNAINYQQVPVVSDTYNSIGPNGSSLSQEIQLSSYVSQSVVLIDGQGISFKDIADYIKKGDSIALGMKVRTAFADGQMGGNYGLKFNLLFKDSVTGNQIIKSFEVDTSDVIGHPYQLINSQWVETLITGVETDNFIGIDSIEAFCNDFPQNENKADIKDIFISDIKINGADALSDSDLTGIILHINVPEGNVLDSTISEIPLVAELKVNGKTTTENVVYYWFRQNGMVFRGDTGKYSGYAGDGWECLNYYSGNSFVPKTNGNFSFNSIEDNLANNSALAPQRVTKVLCVAVYDNKQWIKGQTQIVNNNISNNIRIAVEENDVQTGRTIYYLDNGNPNLVCKTDLSGELEYIWSIKPARGRGEKIEQDSQFINQHAAVVAQWNRVSSNADGMAPASAEQYKNTEEYQNAKEEYDAIKLSPFVSGNIYYNFPISSIVDYSVISCAVIEDGNYKGTVSVTLYNKIQLEGMYSLNLEYGTQVFQYDEKGNSPASPQVERPIEIQPLSFTLIDNEGKEISYDQIINNGYVKWIIPNTQTLLSSVNNGTGTEGSVDLTVTRADLPLSADHYTVYSNLKSFSYAIADQYDVKKDINYIWLHIKYKDLEFDVYTNFTFPKDGDPGTNGTDYVAKIVPSTNTDRIYISDKAPTTIFDDNGAIVANLKFQLYNNSVKVSESANYWNCPPVTQSSVGTDNKRGNTTYLAGNSAWTKPKLNVSGKTLAQIIEDKPVNIIRGQSGTGSDQNDLKYFAEYPVCTEFVNMEDTGYRLKIKPKTGFQYAVYLEDGTRPDYDNTMPFEIIVQKANDSSYWEIDNTDRTYTWYAIGNIEPSTLSGKQASFKPKNTFSGDDLTSAVVCEVSGVGRIHVPIYMILNRYGHNALNGWDGNSIQLNKNGDTILAPQIGAGKKQSDNTYTGVLMGDVKTNSSNDTGIFGYQHGQRSIFLDAKTGNASFGKPGAAQINITASSGEGTIQSGDYSYNTTNHNGKGLKIKFSSTGTGTQQGPYIRYGSNKFSVSADGSIHAAGSGDIAGWSITDSTLYKSNVGLNSNTDNSSYNPNTTPSDKSLSTTNGNMAFWAGTGSGNEAKNFYVTHNGYLFSKSGKIANWNITANRLSQDKVGLNAPASINDNTVAIYAGSSSNTLTNNPFYVTYGGYLRSTSGKIANWIINTTRLSDENVGMGQVVFQKVNNSSSQNPFGQAITARLWGAGSTLTIQDNGNVADNSSSGISSLNFAVSNTGKLYSKSGKIGGWNIGSTSLYAVSNTSGTTGIRLNSNGSMNGGSGYNATTQSGGSWSINTDGSSSFTNITTNYLKATNADVSGTIKANAGYIGGWTINNGNLTSGSMSISSGGSMSGPNWSIDANGNATFNRLSGNISGSMSVGSGGSLTGGGGGGGTWSMPGAGGGTPSWNYGGNGAMTPKTANVLRKIKFNRVGSNAGSTLKFPLNIQLQDVVTGVTLNQHSHSGTITVDGKQGSYTYYTYTLDVDKERKYIIDSYYTSSVYKVVVGGELTSQSITAMSSTINDVEYEED